MRTKDEIVTELFTCVLNGNAEVNSFVERLIKEIWNEAIYVAAENAQAGLDKGGINKQSILKFKNNVSTN